MEMIMPRTSCYRKKKINDSVDELCDTFTFIYVMLFIYLFITVFIQEALITMMFFREVLHIQNHICKKKLSSSQKQK